MHFAPSFFEHLLQKWTYHLQHEEHKEKLIEDLALLKEEVVRDRKYKENFQIRVSGGRGKRKGEEKKSERGKPQQLTSFQPHVWVNERYIRYFIAFILASFFFVLTMCYSFLVNGLVPTVYVTGMTQLPCQQPNEPPNQQTNQINQTNQTNKQATKQTNVGPADLR